MRPNSKCDHNVSRALFVAVNADHALICNAMLGDGVIIVSDRRILRIDRLCGRKLFYVRSQRANEYTGGFDSSLAESHCASHENEPTLGTQHPGVAEP
jgi:hypothetical protein